MTNTVKRVSLLALVIVAAGLGFVYPSTLRSAPAIVHADTGAKQTPLDIAGAWMAKFGKCISPDGGHDTADLGVRLAFSSDLSKPPSAKTWGKGSPTSARCVAKEIDRAVATSALSRDEPSGPVVIFPLQQKPARGSHADVGFEVWATGRYYAHEVTKRQRAADWTALCKRGDEFGLVATRIRSERALLRDEPAWQIDSPDCTGDAVPLFRGLARLRAQSDRLVSAKYPADAADVEPKGIDLEWDGRRYRLWRSQDPDVRPGSMKTSRSLLVLEQGTQTQVLLDRDDGYAGYDLVWAGDFDQDGKLDLLLRGYWGSLYFFLSKDAGPRLVRFAYGMYKESC